MALTAPVFYRMRERNPFAINSYFVQDGETIYHGALVGIETVGVTTGRLVNWNDDSGDLRFKGLAFPNSPSVLGVATATVECAVNEGGPILEQVAVTGATGEANVGDSVHATDENTFDLTATTTVGPIGTVTRFHSGTSCDVQLSPPQEYDGVDDFGQV